MLYWLSVWHFLFSPWPLWQKLEIPRGGVQTVTVTSTSDPSKVSTITFGTDGKPTQINEDDTLGWKYTTDKNDSTKSTLSIQPGFSADFSNISLIDASVSITNSGTISGIKCNGAFTNMAHGTLENFNTYGTVKNYGGTVKNGTIWKALYTYGGTVSGCTAVTGAWLASEVDSNGNPGTLKECTADKLEIKGGIVESGSYNEFSQIDGKGSVGGKVYGGTYKTGNLGTDNNPANQIIGGVFSTTLAKKLPAYTATSYQLKADYCTINQILEDEATVVLGDPTNHPQLVTVESKSDSFVRWEDLDGITLKSGTAESKQISFEMPAHNVTLVAVENKTDLADVINTDGKPTKPGSEYNGWKWDGSTLTIYKDAEINLSSVALDKSVKVVNNGTLTGGIFNGSITNNGTLASGTYNNSVTNENGGTIKDGVFNSSVTNKAGGTIEDGTFKSVSNSGTITKGTFTGNAQNNTTGIINGGIFYNLTDTNNNGTVNGGIFAKDPGTTAGRKRKVTTTDSTIDELGSNKTAYVVGGQKLTITSSSWKFSHWEATGVDVDLLQKSQDDAAKTVSITLDLSAVTADDEITFSPIGSATALQFGYNSNDELTTVDPDDPETEYLGRQNIDNWTYNPTNKTLSLFNGHRVNFTSIPELGWTIVNGGVIEDGTFTGTVTNNETIEKGTFSGAVTNNGTVEDGVFTGRFTNNDGGTVKAGIFSRFADLGANAPSALRLMLDGASANGIPEQVSVVGPHTVTVTADTPEHFDHWEVSGNIDLTALKAKLAETDPATGKDYQHSAELTLELDGTEGTILLTAVTDGYSIASYPIYVFGGEATVNGKAVTKAKAGEKVTVTFQPDSAEESQPFLCWNVQPTTLKLNEDASSTTVTFTMPEEAVTLQAQYQDTTDQARSDGAADGAVGVVLAVAGTALAGWAAYEIGTAIYAQQVLPEGVAMPKTRAELAMVLWQDAGKPLPAAAADGMTELQLAEQWTLETGLMAAQSDGSFAPDQRVGKLEVFRTLKQAQELKPQN